MAGLSTLYENKVLDALFNNTSLAVTTVYVSLHTADPGDETGASEFTDTNYARIAATFGAASNGSVSNDAEVLFNAIADAGPFVATHFGLWTASTAGDYIGSGALSTSKSFSQNDIPRFPLGALVLTAE